MNKTIITLALLILLSCSHKTKTFTEADIKRGTEKFPETTLASLTEGKVYYEKNCGACHPLKDPSARTEEKWNKIVPKMVIKVNQKLGREEIDAKKQDLILHYLVTMSTATPKTQK
jgi:cytochrome c5